MLLSQWSKMVQTFCILTKKENNQSYPIQSETATVPKKQIKIFTWPRICETASRSSVKCSCLFFLLKSCCSDQVSPRGGRGGPNTSTMCNGKFISYSFSELIGFKQDQFENAVVTKMNQNESKHGLEEKLQVSEKKQNSVTT